MKVDYEKLFFDMIVDLTLADHIGDAMNTVGSALKVVDPDIDFYSSEELVDILKEYAGADYSHERPDGYYYK